MNQITIKPNLTPRMLFRGYWAIDARKIMFAALKCLIVTVLAFIALLVKPDALFTLFGLVACPILWMIFVYYYFIGPWRYYKCYYNKSIEEDENIEITVDNDSLIWKTNESETRHKWTVLTALVERSDFFIVQLKNNWMIVIQKTAFTREEDMSQFQELLKTKLER